MPECNYSHASDLIKWQAGVKNDQKEILYGLSCPNAYNAGVMVFVGCGSTYILDI